MENNTKWEENSYIEPVRSYESKNESVMPDTTKNTEIKLEKEEETEQQLLDLNYPESDIKRFPVVIKYKSWFIKWKEYEPVKYTAQSVLLNPAADLDLVS